MTLNPTLKSILVRTAYIVGSLTIYYIAYNYCLDYLDFHYWSDGGLIDGHPTLRYTLLMMAAAILIWVNIRKLSRPNIRLPKVERITLVTSFRVCLQKTDILFRPCNSKRSL